MIEFTTSLKQFGEQGEKTGWTYIEVPADLAQALKPGNKKSFRVKGQLDRYPISGVALIPMGAGNFILAVNATMRKGIGKRKGAMVKVRLAEDKIGFVMNADFLDCLDDEPAAKKFFQSLPGAHQRYFSRWIDSAKTDTTRTARIAEAVSALSRKLGYAEMIRARKSGRPD